MPRALTIAVVLAGMFAGSVPAADLKVTPRPACAAPIPEGSTARCRDGTYSSSQDRQQACSGHGGVAELVQPRGNGKCSLY
jgi:hypothetical protein